ncbi:MAG: thiamine pyrophosphate-dependent dehydrogenase E1 component subunit alpha [Alphaproteobacteria bacterium]|nr:thiamine pyrophosphate-dependent dehydrogenase E1 component subunit alpha [Alphaproteobacteria bacterium]
MTVRLYRSLRLIRRVEEVVAEIYPSDKIKSPVHLSIGQEAVAVGVCDTLRADDVVSGTYRSHAAYIAKGGDLKAMFAELYGKATGCAGGKAGSMHLIDMGHNILGSSAVVGTTVPIALGYAYAIRRRGEDRVVVAYFGDGATEEGVFHESLNFAALKQLPVLFVCENNQFAIHQPLEKRWATDRLCERVETYGISAKKFADSNVESIRTHTQGAIAEMRAGGGPAFMECVTYRWREHVGPGEDYDAGYRDRTEYEAWSDKDEVARLGAALGENRRADIDAEIEQQIAEAVEFAESSPFPAIEELHTHVFAG